MREREREREREGERERERERERENWYFILYYCYYKCVFVCVLMSIPNGAMGWSLLSMIVPFPGHTHLILDLQWIWNLLLAPFFISSQFGY